MFNDREKFLKINEDHDFISYFTDWSEENFSSVWFGTKRSLDDLDEGAFEELVAKDYTKICPKTYYGGTLVKTINPIKGHSAEPESCVESGFGLWKDKIPIHKHHYAPLASGTEIHSEFFV